jgi:hypothetical protein
MSLMSRLSPSAGKSLLAVGSRRAPRAKVGLPTGRGYGGLVSSGAVVSPRLARRRACQTPGPSGQTDRRAAALELENAERCRRGGLTRS